jgi:hypothetical protein
VHVVNARHRFGDVFRQSLIVTFTDGAHKIDLSILDFYGHIPGVQVAVYAQPVADLLHQPLIATLVVTRTDPCVWARHVPPLFVDPIIRTGETLITVVVVLLDEFLFAFSPIVWFSSKILPVTEITPTVFQSGLVPVAAIMPAPLAVSGLSAPLPAPGVPVFRDIALPVIRIGAAPVRIAPTRTPAPFVRSMWHFILLSLIYVLPIIVWWQSGENGGFA